MVIYTGQAWEPWGPRNLDTGGIGGSETWAVYVAREFARRGYDVTVYGDPGDQAGMHDGVRYDQYFAFDSNAPMDIFISSRRADVLATNARRRICVVHDIWLHPDQSYNINYDRFDRFFVLSPWHKAFFCSHHTVSGEKVFVTRNGIDLSRFTGFARDRVRGRMIYSSSPDRGLDILLDCMPRIRQRVPEANLRVFYGFDNWKKAVQMRKNPHEIAWMERIEEQLKQPGVTYVGRIGQKQLAAEFMQAELWAYPTYFTETFCITALEAMAAGVPVVTSSLAGLATTVGADGGIMLDGDPRSEAYQHTFVELCCYVLNDRTAWEELSNRGRTKAAKYSWESLIDEWMPQLQ